MATALRGDACAVTTVRSGHAVCPIPQRPPRGHPQRWPPHPAAQRPTTFPPRLPRASRLDRAPESQYIDAVLRDRKADQDAVNTDADWEVDRTPALRVGAAARHTEVSVMHDVRLPSSLSHSRDGHHVRTAPRPSHAQSRPRTRTPQASRSTADLDGTTEDISMRSCRRANIDESHITTRGVSRPLATPIRRRAGSSSPERPPAAYREPQGEGFPRW